MSTGLTDPTVARLTDQVARQRKELAETVDQLQTRLDPRTHRRALLATAAVAVLTLAGVVVWRRTH